MPTGISVAYLEDDISKVRLSRARGRLLASDAVYGARSFAKGTLISGAVLLDDPPPDELETGLEEYYIFATCLVEQSRTCYCT